MGKTKTEVIQTVRLIAIRPHPYAGRELRVGDVYEATPEHAQALVAAKASRFEESPEVKDKSQREYKRRDLKAET